MSFSDILAFWVFLPSGVISVTLSGKTNRPTITFKLRTYRTYFSVHVSQTHTYMYMTLIIFDKWSWYCLLCFSQRHARITCNKYMAWVLMCDYGWLFECVSIFQCLNGLKNVNSVARVAILVYGCFHIRSPFAIIVRQMHPRQPYHHNV